MSWLNNSLEVFPVIPMQQSELHARGFYEDLHGYSSIYSHMQNLEQISSESSRNLGHNVEAGYHKIPDLSSQNSWTTTSSQSEIYKPSCAYVACDSPSSPSLASLVNLSQKAYELQDTDIPPAEYFIPEIHFDDILSCEESANTSSGASSDDSAIWSDFTASLNSTNGFLDASQSSTCDMEIKKSDRHIKTTTSSPTSYMQNLSEDYEDNNMKTTPAAKVKDESEVKVKSTVKVTESPNEDKPPEPYLNMIAKAIMSTGDQTMMLNDIYNHIYDKYPFFKNTKCAWRSSVRYNLSVNECFIKCSRGKNGRGFYWGIHPACLEDFQKGNYNRRQARRRVQSDTKKLEASIKQAQITHCNLSPIATALREVHNIQSPLGSTFHYRFQNNVRAHPYATNTPLRITHHQLQHLSHGVQSSYSPSDMAGSPYNSYSGSPMNYTSTPYASRDQTTFLYMNE